jgi:hypothetical protein
MAEKGAATPTSYHLAHPLSSRLPGRTIFMTEQHHRDLLDKVEDAIRRKQCSSRTAQAYLGWIERYLDFHGGRHPVSLGVVEVEAFLTHLLAEGHVACPGRKYTSA